MCEDCSELSQGEPGYNGWGIIPANIVDSTNLDSNGDSRVVEQVINWTGGTGPTPTQYIGQYIASTGPTATLSAATNLRGAKGVGYNLTSSTNINMPIALGSKTLTVSLAPNQSAFSVGCRVRVADLADPTVNFFEGIVTAYTSATNFVLDVDYSTQTVTSNISNWNIDITGLTGATAGFNDVPWVEIVQGDMTIGSTFAPVHTIDSRSGTGTFDATGFNGASRIRYKQLGKTMLLNWYIDGTCTIVNTGETVGVQFFIKVPNSKIANSQYDSGSAFLVPVDATAFANEVLPNTCTPYSSDLTYIATQNFAFTNLGGGGTSAAFLLNGSIVFETTT